MLDIFEDLVRWDNEGHASGRAARNNMTTDVAGRSLNDPGTTVALHGLPVKLDSPHLLKSL